MKFSRNTRLALAALILGSNKSRYSQITNHFTRLTVASVAALSLCLAWAANVNANEVDLSSGKVKVGVLHSLSGTMAISETSLRDTLLFAFDEINKSGGVLGK